MPHFVANTIIYAKNMTTRIPSPIIKSFNLTGNEEVYWYLDGENSVIVKFIKSTIEKKGEKK